MTIRGNVPLSAQGEGRIGLRGGVLHLVVGLSLQVLAGCAAQGVVVDLEIRGNQPLFRTAPSCQARLTVAIVPFVDKRWDRSRLGTRTDWLGSPTTFRVVGDDLGEMIALDLIDYLRRRMGWRTWIAKPGVTPPEGGADVIISGSVLEAAADAPSRPWGTVISVRTAIMVKLQNQRNGSTFHLVASDRGAQRVLWFEPQDVVHALQQSLRKGFEKLIAESIADHPAFQLK